MSDNPGMMGEAYFVGKRQLLDWINGFLGMNYTKVEQVASGAAHCQLLDAIFPGKVPISKINFDAKYDYDFVKNYKILQNVFDKQNIEKRIPVQKLIKAKYQDNLEFLQWMKNFFDVRYSGDEYDAVGRRNAARRKQGKKIPARAPSLATSKTSETKRSSLALNNARKPARGTSVKQGVSGDAKKQLRAKDKEIASLKEKVNEMIPQIELLEKERTFYYSKLRSIEVMMQETESEVGLKDKILEILYQTDEGFEAPPDEEEEQEQA